MTRAYFRELVNELWGLMPEGASMRVRVRYLRTLWHGLRLAPWTYWVFRDEFRARLVKARIQESLLDEDPT